ncbi:sugar phosphate isomerase/epimerase family protein [Enterococcus dongliensis]|uniref:sugar phosphate isomerase/epimerase family protein n=1 Tax=Enterococcus dongliensis TaxID=2559925 RepID=UPI00288D34DE|nr:TIM barrel protein [Enterococcus dongliensis]MDT2674972.1 TIM barrel protein [Enterococcus dongliensis]
MSKIKTAVSLYSLQDEYLNHRMDLDDLMYFLKEHKVEGVEILPDQMIKKAPHPVGKDVDHWQHLLEETGIKPVIADVFLNTNLYNNRTLTKQECINLLIEEIKQANLLGFKLIRLVSMVPYWVCEPLLPYCKKYDVTIALEIHAGMAFDEPETHQFIEEMKRLDSPYIGLVIDTGIFCQKFPRVVAAYEINNGASPEMFDYLDRLFEQKTDLHRVLSENNGNYPEEFKKVIKTKEDQMFAPLCDGYENYPFTIMDEYIPYIKHFHIKLFEMTPEGPEYSMDYKGLLEYLHEKNYDGYVATEYEGNRFTLPGESVQEKEQVAANQKYLQDCLKDIQG